MGGIICRSNATASTTNVLGTSTDSEAEPNPSTPKQLPPLNSDYAVFANSTNSVIISVTLVTSASFSSVKKFLMISYNHSHYSSNVYLFVIFNNNKLSKKSELLGINDETTNFKVKCSD